VLLSRLHVSSLLNVTLHLYMITGKNLSTPNLQSLWEYQYQHHPTSFFGPVDPFQVGHKILDSEDFIFTLLCLHCVAWFSSISDLTY
jgi:hypothetical protein